MTTPSLSRKEMFKITGCLTITCLIAAAILGMTYRFTEPTRRLIAAKHEASAVRRLLNLPEGGYVVEVGRYLKMEPSTVTIGYLLPTELHLYTNEGKAIQTIQRPTEAHDTEQWMETHFPQARQVGRFFIGKTRDGKDAGYVTESTQYGFKSRIRFLVALSEDFTIRGVEVTEHEEDPGLGAEITKAFFKNQFAARSFDSLANLDVTKDPLPAARRNSMLELEKSSFESWHSNEANAFDSDKEPIYAVTGATISSKALTDGVKKAVAHLRYRLAVVKQPQGVSP